MPLYTLRNKTTGQTVQVTDPGRAMIDGKWSHIGRFKGPMLRNLAPRTSTTASPPTSTPSWTSTRPGSTSA